MKNILIVLLVLTFPILLFGFMPAKKVEVNYTSVLQNSNHPEICYFFINKEILESGNYLGIIDSIAQNTKFTTVFLTGHENADFYDPAFMHPYFKRLVEHAHQQKLKVGLQLWNTFAPVAIENTSRVIVEGEIILDQNGCGSYTAVAKNIRQSDTPKGSGGVNYPINMGKIIKSELFKVYAFQKTSDGFYEPNSLCDITNKCKADSINPKTVEVNINAGKEMKGRSTYIMTQHFYNFPDNYSQAAIDYFSEALHNYSDIPFDGFAFDEYGNMRVEPSFRMKGNFRERIYSLPMAKVFQERTGKDLTISLFDMRYAPEGKPEVRIKAINSYMEIMRTAPLRVENAVCKEAQKIFGNNIFIGFHSTHHNSLQYDEIWTTGCNWWTIPRKYGFTDEGTMLPTQLGIAMVNEMNALYNMYYNKDIDKFVNKAFSDLKYDIRTIYLAYNNIDGSGKDLRDVELTGKINKVESCARLMNHFNPALPETKLLVVFGMEALANWYPDNALRGQYDIADKLEVEQKAKTILDAGYLNAFVSSDVIIAGKLIIGIDGKPVMNGHKFDAVVYLYPQYAHEQVLKFLEHYLEKGGKLMIEGAANYDFMGNDISSRFKNIVSKATVKGFSTEKIALLGVVKKQMADFCKNEDGSIVFTDYMSFSEGTETSFSNRNRKTNFEISCQGFAIIAFNTSGILNKLVSYKFKSLKIDGKEVLSVNKPADILFEFSGKSYKLTIVDNDKEVQVVTNLL